MFLASILKFQELGGWTDCFCSPEGGVLYDLCIYVIFFSQKTFLFHYVVVSLFSWRVVMQNAVSGGESRDICKFLISYILIFCLKIFVWIINGVVNLWPEKVAGVWGNNGGDTTFHHPVGKDRPVSPPPPQVPRGSRSYSTATLQNCRKPNYLNYRFQNYLNVTCQRYWGVWQHIFAVTQYDRGTGSERR